MKARPFPVLHPPSRKPHNVIVTTPIGVRPRSFLFLDSNLWHKWSAAIDWLLLVMSLN